MPELSGLDWVALALAASLVGFAKTAVGGVASISVAVFAFVLPARESTGAVLALLLVGDMVALALYRRHADWGILLRLLPSVVPGLVLGAWFLAWADQDLMRRAIGAVLVTMVVLQLESRRRAALSRAGSTSGTPVDVDRGAGEAGAPALDVATVALRGRPARTSTELRLAPVAVGLLAGFATMTANAAGPVMALYLLLAGLPVLGLLGTGAWFFLLVNLAKVPFSAGLDLMDGPTLLMDLALVPALLVGAAVGAVVARRIPRRRFEDATVVLTLVAATALLV